MLGNKSVALGFVETTLKKMMNVDIFGLSPTEA